MCVPRKLSPQEIIAQRWEILDKALGPRSYSAETQESRIDNETFRATRFEDYSYCKNTFDEMIKAPAPTQYFAPSTSKVLDQDQGDFGF